MLANLSKANKWVIVNFSAKAGILFNLKCHFKCMRSDEHFDFGLRSVRGALGIPAGPIGGAEGFGTTRFAATAEARRKFEA